MQNAVENLISRYATNIEIDNTEDIQGLIDAIIKANDNLSDSLNSNDWELMGTDVQKLQDLINSLKKQVKDEKESGSEVDGDETDNSSFK